MVYINCVAGTLKQLLSYYVLMLHLIMFYHVINNLMFISKEIIGSSVQTFFF